MFSCRLAAVSCGVYIVAHFIPISEFPWSVAKHRRRGSNRFVFFSPSTSKRKYKKHERPIWMRSKKKKEKKYRNNSTASRRPEGRRRRATSMFATERDIIFNINARLLHFIFYFCLSTVLTPWIRRSYQFDALFSWLTWWDGILRW